MEHSNFTSLVVVVIAAFLTPILINRLKISFLPVVVAEIIMGVIIGDSLFGLVKEDAWLSTLSTLGFIFLMFLSGLEIDFTAFKTKKVTDENEKHIPSNIYLTTVVFSMIMVLSILLAFIFKWTGLVDDVLLMVIIISTISLGVVVPTLKEMNIMHTSIGQFILLVAVVADLSTMLLLTVYGTLYAKGDSPLWLIAILVVFSIIFYIMGGLFKRSSFLQKLTSGTTQIGIRAVFALIILLVALAEGVGAENILGAFLAGVIVSLLGPNQDMVEKLDSFGYGFFIPIFFIMVGVNLNIPALVKEPSLLIIIPLLFIAFLISKIIPISFIGKWYDKKTTIASSFLLTSTLSLVIAAAKIAEQLGTISPEISGILILSAVITCVVVPIVFKKLFPIPEEIKKVVKVSFIGKNQLSIPVAQSIHSNIYQTTMYFRKDLSDNRSLDKTIKTNELDEYREEELEKLGLFNSDIIVCSANDDIINKEVALMAHKHGVKRIICKQESITNDEELSGKNIEFFSSFLSNKILLKGLIESPNMLNLLSNVETSLYEIEMKNHAYHNVLLRSFPFAGDIIFVRIIRGVDSIVPHGDTELQYGDKLIVTGSKEYVSQLKQDMELV
ncbi:monovalent cation:proton antiporter family protein [Mammaliicoccus stepanovicii]|uniref:Na+/H+ antiporter-like protein n=1 Tax=Mammaliicoccus stepanovicii TaxID=643214 RepID=A0A239ZS47_9STAP|nr:monovalent cation:proton antiporter family protein [Mammaliicoccus stepanovicii]PNZ77093.1 sodium:proton antiporter [Mammaliicoccus stepanovicii]GGI38813.1 sodium:proton antiporter [Mammaliicoccus stepanovicii]SNV73925.1 Na+/H+ antiporter-like protein [Mammaliicoccus stepanovicii]